MTSKLGEHHAWCVICSRDVNVSASGSYDVKTRMKSKLHERNAKSAQQHVPMTGFFKARTANVPESTTTAEVMFAYFVAEHNLPASVADHFSTLVPRLFADSGKAKHYDADVRRRLWSWSVAWPWRAPRQWLSDVGQARSPWWSARAPTGTRTSASRVSFGISIRKNAKHILACSTCRCITEMDRLMRKLFFKFVPLRLIHGQPDLRQLKYDSLENQHPDDMIAIGMTARAFVADENLEPAKITKFFR